jgi:hypothetical protein
MWWYREGNKEQGWRRVGSLSLQALFTYLCDLCAFEYAISPLILLFSTPPSNPTTETSLG